MKKYFFEIKLIVSEMSAQTNQQALYLGIREFVIEERNVK